MPTKKTGKARTTRKTTVKKGKSKTKVGIKGADAAKVLVGQATGKPPDRIRMLMSLSNQYGSFQKGHEYDVPHDVRVPTARNWVRSGAAEEVE